jgi:transcriptional regulator with XRE-family HTH domain
MGLNLKVIFGMKLKQYREHAGLSLTDFAAKTGLSSSYLTEIEHGKKYPKAEKIARLADALGRNYDDLVSIRLDEGLSPLAGFLSSPVLHNFPYHLFGISPAQLVELMTRQPLEASALVSALVGIAEQYNIGVEHLYRAALRSYQELHGNYFAEIESALDDFVRSAEVECLPTPSYSTLSDLIKTRFNYRIDEQKLNEQQRLRRFRSVLVTGNKQSPLLLINPGLSERQKKFILAREIGYRVLDIKDRALTSPPERIESFEQVLGDFKASYFAGALLVNRESVIGDMKAFFKLPRWQPERLHELLRKYEVTPEIFMYRLTEVLPQFFGFKMHFLRFNHERDRFRLVKHLNMSQILIPNGIGLDEHYCERWLAIRILKDLERRGGADPQEPLVDAQVSHFVDTETKYFCFGMARHLALTPTSTSSVSLGFRWDDVLSRTIKFASDPAITRLNINGTCERCRLAFNECRERTAPPHLLELQQAHEEVERELASLQA